MSDQDFSEKHSIQTHRDHRAAYLLSEGGVIAAAMTLLASSWHLIAGACVVGVYIVGWVTNYLIYTHSEKRPGDTQA